MIRAALLLFAGLYVAVAVLADPSMGLW